MNDHVYRIGANFIIAGSACRFHDRYFLSSGTGAEYFIDSVVRSLHFSGGCLVYGRVGQSGQNRYDQVL